MIKSVEIKNYRSFQNATVELAPFSLLIGPNGAGKSNFLKFISDVTDIDLRARRNVQDKRILFRKSWPKHINLRDQSASFRITWDDGSVYEGDEKGIVEDSTFSFTPGTIRVFNLDPAAIAGSEKIVPKAEVQANGSGTAQVLDVLKGGDREDLFNAIETNLKACVPEIEKLSLNSTKEGQKQIQVRERGIALPVPAHQLSEGTRLILAVLTIIHQENPPPVILLEDVDRGMHPRIFESMAELMEKIARKSNVTIVATTHNPYLVDCFGEKRDSVILVEKKDAATALSTLEERLRTIDYTNADAEDMPLGNLWFTGLVGGVPEFLKPRKRDENLIPPG